MSEQNPDSTPAKQPKPKAPWDEVIRTIIYAILLAVIFRSFAYEPFHIPSGSMKSNLLIGDYLFVSKSAYGYSRYSFPLGLPLFEGRILDFNKPERGDVVVFRLPKNPRIDFIKRVIGLPGDRIQMIDGVVYLNGKPLKRDPLGEFPDRQDNRRIKIIPSYIETLPEGKKIVILKERRTSIKDNTDVYVVPEGHYFMIGDNRDNSRDSRFLDEVGFVPEENIVGRAEIIFFSTKPNASFSDPSEWSDTLRWHRFFKLIH